MRRPSLALTVAALAGDCGDDDPGPGTTHVMVPGQEAVDIRADCVDCEPADAGDGDTDYACRGGRPLPLRHRMTDRRPGPCDRTTIR